MTDQITDTEPAPSTVDAEKLAQIPTDWAEPPAGTVSKLNRGLHLTSVVRR